MEYKFSNSTGMSIDMGNMENTFFLVGLLNEFMNRFQTVGDRFFKEMSWKQCFVLICIRLFEEPPTLKELSELMGSSHQNIKQMLLKLEKGGYVEFVPDETDRRKQRIVVTNRAEDFSQKYDAASAEFMKNLFENIDAKSLETTVATIIQMDNQLKKMDIPTREGGSKC